MLDASALCSFFKNRCNHVDNNKICLHKTGNKTANINVKKLQSIHTVNTHIENSTNHKKTIINHNNIA